MEYEEIEVHTIEKLYADDVIIEHEILGRIRVSSYSYAFEGGVIVSCKPREDGDFYTIRFPPETSSAKDEHVKIAISQFLKMLEEDL